MGSPANKFSLKAGSLRWTWLQKKKKKKKKKETEKIKFIQENLYPYSNNPQSWSKSKS